GGLRVKLIECHRICRGQQAKLLGLDDQMQKSLLCTDRTVAVGDAFEISRHLEPDSAALASPLIGWHTYLYQQRAYSSLTAFALWPMARSLRSLYGLWPMALTISYKP